MPDHAPDRPLDWWGVAGTVVCCALWGGNAVAVKAAVPDLPAVGCSGVRFFIALPIIALVCWKLGHEVRVRRSLWWLLLAHGLITAVQIGTFNWGASHSLAGRSSVFINVHPLVVAPLAWIFLGERMGKRAIAGLASAALGVVVLLYEPLTTGGGLAGDLIVLVSGLVFGVQTIAQKLTFPKIPATTLLIWQTLFAGIFALSFSGAIEGFDAFHFTSQAKWGLAYQGIAVSGICFTLWMLLLRRYPAGRLAAIAFTTPLFGVFFGNIARNEPLTLPLLLGGLFVGLGIYLVASERTKQRLEPDIALPGEDAP